MRFRIYDVGFRCALPKSDIINPKFDTPQYFDKNRTLNTGLLQVKGILSFSCLSPDLGSL
jgi:hypothetical protein